MAGGTEGPSGRDTRLLRSAALNGVAGLALTAALGAGLAAFLQLGEAYVARALVAYAALATAAAWFLPQHMPHARLGPANQVTLARVALTALLAGLVGEGDGPPVAWTALGLALLAEGLDGVDGHLARRLGWASAFGARFDMETDAALVAVLAVLAWTLGKAGPWVLAAGLLRYGFVAAACGWPWLARPLPPSRRRQAVCVAQILTLTVALAPPVPPPLAAAVASVGLTLLCYSFAADIHWLVRQARSGASTPFSP
jgi:phosphatidylglycerophosphate synthase